MSGDCSSIATITPQVSASKPYFAAGVADLGDRLADEPRDVHVGLGRDLAGDDDEAGRDQRLAGDAAVRVVGEDGVEDRVRDLVGDLVRVPLGDRLGREEERARAIAARQATAARRTGDLTGRTP